MGGLDGWYVFGGIVALLVALSVLMNLRDIKRYLRIRFM